MPTRSGTTKPVRPSLAGSVSVDAQNLLSSSTESEKKLRRHSATVGGLRDKETSSIKPDGSLRKVSRWFRDFKQKMDPKMVKDRIRYSRPSLVQQANVNEEDGVNVFRRHDKTATMEPRRSGRKQLEKRFNSMENLPASQVLSPHNLRKMMSLQLDSNDDELETYSRPSDLFSELTQTESLDAITEAISLKLNERGKVFNEILQPSTQNQLKQSQTPDVKLSVLASASLTSELTHLINVSIQPGNVHLKKEQCQQQQQPEDQLQPLQPTTTINTTTPEDKIILKKPVCIYIDSSSKFVEIVGCLQYQLSNLLMTLDENSEKMNRLKMKIDSAKSSAEAEAQSDHSVCTLQEPISSTPRQERTLLHSSPSDSECFLSLINDLGDTPDDNKYRI